MKLKWFWLICILMLGIATPAFAVRTIDSGYNFLIAAGESRMPDYPDLAYMIGDGLTKDDFTITIESDYSRIFSEDGRVTITPDTYRPLAIKFQMVYTPKVSGVGTKTIFTGYICVREPLDKITAKPESVTLSVEEKTTIQIIQPSGSIPDLRLADYDSSIIDATLVQEYGGSTLWKLSITPKQKGETTLEVVAYNGVKAEIPVKVMDPPSQLTFAQEVFTCYVGDTIDLGADLGGGGMLKEPRISIQNDYSFDSSTPFFPDDWRHFYGMQSGNYHITMTLYNGVQGEVRVNVYDRVNCERITLDSAVPNVGEMYTRIHTYDAAGNEINCPIELTKGTDIAYIEKRMLRSTAPGIVELTATNPDGSKFIQSMEIYDRPSQLILNKTRVTMDIGDVFDLEVSFDKGKYDYYLNLNSDGKTYPFDLSPVRMEGQTFIAQAPGTYRVSVHAESLWGEVIFTVRDSDKAVSLICPEEPFGINHTFQFRVVDRTGKEYPAVFSVDNPTTYDACTITPDGYVTGLTTGLKVIVATLADGRRLKYNLTVYKVPRWIKHPIIVCYENSTLVRLSNVQSDVGALSSSDVTVSVADETIAYYRSGQFTILKPGTTAVTLTANRGGATTSFTMTVLEANHTLHAGVTSLDIPFGYSTLLPAVTDAQGNTIPLFWEITYQEPGAYNPYGEAFLLEENVIMCIWPDSYCEVTGTASSGQWIRVSVHGYRLPDHISFRKSIHRLQQWHESTTEFASIADGCDPGPVEWTVSDPTVIEFRPAQSRGQRPAVRALKPGAAILTATLLNGASAKALVMVEGDTPVTLPASLAAIGDQAFMNGSYTDVYCPSGLKSIGSGAFAGCSRMVLIYLPESVTSIADDAFSGCTQLTICCKEGSYPHAYAKKHGIPCAAY